MNKTDLVGRGENIEKLKTEKKENAKLKVWEAPKLIMMDGDDTEVGLYHAAENHSATIPFSS